MILHVRLYGTNADGIPADWPAECVEVADGTPAPDGQIAMTVAEYEAYRADRQAAYDAWEAQWTADQAVLRLQRMLAQARAQAQTKLDDAKDDVLLLIRAVVLELLGYANAHRAQHNALLTWLGGQAQLTQRAQLTGMQTPQATPAQARTAIKNRIQAGEAD